MSYTVKIIDNDNKQVLLDSDRIEVLLGSYVERADHLRCSCSMVACIASALPPICSSYNALEELRRNIAKRYPAVLNSGAVLDGIAFDSEDELERAIADSISEEVDQS